MFNVLAVGCFVFVTLFAQATELRQARSQDSKASVEVDSAPLVGNAPEVNKQTQKSIGVWTVVNLCFYVVLVVVIILGCVFFLWFNDGRVAAWKFWCILRRTIGVEMGIGGLIRVAMICCIPGLTVAITKGFHDGFFDWGLALLILFSITATGVVQSIVENSQKGKRLLSPGAGHVWRNDRKSTTAGILAAVDKLFQEKLTSGKVDVKHAHNLLTDLLDVIASHVRDHRGCSRAGAEEMFASILVDDGSEFVVICRDNLQHSEKHKRQLLTKTDKRRKICGKALEQGKAVTVGCLKTEFPEGAHNKPYSSILAVPIYWNRSEQPIGCVSVDGVKDYMFDSFVPGRAADEIENSLLPYLRLVTLVVSLIASDNKELLDEITKVVEREGNHV